MRTAVFPPVISMKPCLHCRSRNVSRVKNRIASGAFQIFDLCGNCGENARGSAIYIPHKQAGIALEAIPLHKDYTLTAPPCIVCGSRDGTDNHHFAPRHIFQDAEKWPQGALCNFHHREWHTKMAAHIMKDNCKYCKGLANGKR